MNTEGVFKGYGHGPTQGRKNGMVTNKFENFITKKNKKHQQKNDVMKNKYSVNYNYINTIA